MTKLALFIAMTCFNLGALAAQNAMVTSEQAPIRERPSLDSKIIETKTTGTKLRVSSFNKEGWFKTKASNGQFGWIWQADMAVLAFSDDIRTAQLELKDKEFESRRSYKQHWLYLKAGGQLYGLFSGDVSSRLGLGKGRVYLAPGGFGELAVRLDDRLKIAARFATYSNTTSLKHFDVPYSINMSGTPLLLGLQAEVSRQTTWEIEAGFYAGIAMNSLQVTATNGEAPNSFTVSATSWAVLLNFSAKWWLWNWGGVVGEFGAYFSEIPKTNVPNTFNGDAPFRDDVGNLATIRVNQIGPVLSLGFLFAL